MIPEEFRDVFKTPVGSYLTLPFGWNLAPILAQKTLEDFIWSSVMLLGYLPFVSKILWFWVYLDDVFILSPDRFLLETFTNDICSSIKSNNLILSKKSHLDPGQDINWLGKRFDLLLGVVANLDKSFLKALGMGILSCLLPLSVSRLDHLLGTLNWIFRPIPGYILFTGPWYQWRWLPKRKSVTASHNLQKLLLDTLIMAFHGWHLPKVFAPKLLVPILCVDAACINNCFQIGAFSPLIGARLVQCPSWVSSQ